MKRFMIKHSSCDADGFDFEVDDDATEEEIHEAAWEIVSQCVDFGYEEITDKEPQ